MSEIKNRVANSSLQIFDLEDYYPKKEIVTLDIAQFLVDGFFLKEKDFREQLKKYNWSIFANKNIALYCSTEAVLPIWTFSLLTVYLQPIANKIVQGSVYEFVKNYYQEKLTTLDYLKYKNKPVILKGCSQKTIPQEIYVLAIQKLMPFAKSIMFGEACSAVPLYKNKNNRS